jgi:hypothetical protein
MIVLRLLVPTVAALALSATASAAGPCTQQIAQVQAQIDAKLAANAATGPAAPESPGALLSRQPTPGSIAAAESKLGELSQEVTTAIAAGMARAREADLAGNQSACEEALAEVRTTLGP